MTAEPKNRLGIAGPFIRDIVFGVHDALLTNIGIVTGFVAALQDTRLIILTVIIDVIVSAFAMSFGTYLSRTSESDYLKGQLDREEHETMQDILANPIIAAVVMWVTYVVTGMIPLLPFFFNLPSVEALRIAIVLSLVVFLAVGAFKGVVTGTSPWRGGLQFFAFGSVAAVIGYVIGQYGQQLLGG